MAVAHKQVGMVSALPANPQRISGVFMYCLCPHRQKSRPGILHTKVDKSRRGVKYVQVSATLRGGLLSADYALEEDDIF